MSLGVAVHEPTRVWLPEFKRADRACQVETVEVVEVPRIMKNFTIELAISNFGAKGCSPKIRNIHRIATCDPRPTCPLRAWPLESLFALIDWRKRWQL